MRKYTFEEKMFLGYLFPTILSGIGQALSNIADSVVVGQTIGETGLAAIALNYPLYMIYAVFYGGLAIGGSVLFANLVGAGKKEEAAENFSMILEVSLTIGLLFTVCGMFFTEPVLRLLGTVPSDGELYELSYSYAHVLLLFAPVLFVNIPLFFYVRYDDDPRLASLGYTIGSLLDVFFSILFVMILHMGVAGSIWATILGQSVSILIYLSHFIGRKNQLQFHLILPDSKKILSAFRTGFASSNQYLFQFVFTMLVNRILLGLYGDMAVAVFDIVMNMAYIALIFTNAVNDSMQPVVSTLHGERNRKEEQNIYHMSLRYALILEAILLTIEMILAKQICLFFGVKATQTMQMGIMAVRLYCLSAFVASFNLIKAGYHQAIEQEKLTYLGFFMRGFLFLVGAVLLLSWLLPGYFWYCYLLAELLTLPVLFGAELVFSLGDLKIVAESEFCTFTLSTREDLLHVMEEAESFCDLHAISMRKGLYVSNTIEEVCCAIIDHAAMKKGRTLLMQVTLCMEGENSLRLSIRDNAMEFNPFDMNTRKITGEEDEDEEMLLGLGILMVKNKAREFYYNRYQSFNTMIVVV